MTMTSTTVGTTIASTTAGTTMAATLIAGHINHGRGIYLQVSLAVSPHFMMATIENK
jgi:hypothetical protein